MELPALGKYPYGSELKVKATASGITILRENAYGKRYTGNKYSAVDNNGKLWLKASELRRHLALVERNRAYLKELSRYAIESHDRPGVWYWLSDKRPKKIPPVETGGRVNKLKPEQMQISDNFSTLETPLLTVPPTLSTTKAREYRIKKREVRQRLLGFINTQKGSKELYFWTVTFPKGTPDNVAYQMFNIWLTALRQRKMLKDYLWIAERQKVGTVHFHIAVPHKMSVKYANGMMQTTLKTFSKRGEIPFSVYACKRYNGVDIAKNRKTKRVTNFAIKKGTRALITYLTKYVTKNDTAFSHLAWHNSRGFSSIFTGVTFTIQEFVKFGFHDLIDRRKEKRFSTEYFTFVPWLNDPPTLITEHLYKLNSYIQSLLN
jgi:hypothetical protein